MENVLLSKGFKMPVYQRTQCAPLKYHFIQITQECWKHHIYLLSCLIILGEDNDDDCVS